jgi:hypothetical protein
MHLSPFAFSLFQILINYRALLESKGEYAKIKRAFAGKGAVDDRMVKKDLAIVVWLIVISEW